jgi:hypothetical protein
MEEEKIEVEEVEEVEYEGQEEEFDTLSFYDKYDDHAKVVNLLTASQEAERLTFS